ncbi:MAG TPA: gamma-glutamyltransferase [candidate division Zixibacteria bacterium]|nr:gamma-glutamyltransferase [candidate division Zixibacteria bacterium]
MAGRFSVFASNGMVVSSRELATLAGVQVLACGGNAVDAAVATAAVLGVVEPMSIGVGGDAFCLLYSARDGTLKGLDASGRSPFGASLEFFRKNGFAKMPERGIHSITVPGAVHGWETLVREYGTKPLGELLQPAVFYAENGFPVAEPTAESWRESEALLRADEGAALNYLVGGRAPRAGEIFRNPRMGKTLRCIADGGAEVFYRGEIAERIVRCSQRLGGIFTRRDFTEHRSEWVEPLSVRYRGYDVVQLPPATQGFVALEMLKILEGFDLASLGYGSPSALHLMIEAKKLAFADRDRHLADRDFMEVPVGDLIAAGRAQELRGRIRMDAAARQWSGACNGADTEYVAAADAQGNLVSFIQSNFMGFGSGVVEPETAIVLQNRGHLFSLEEHHPNRIGPHKRCAHTLMPGLVLKEGKPCLALGLKGGHVQPQVQVQLIVNLIDFGMGLQEAVSAARFNHVEGADVALEPEIPPAAARELAEKGHRLIRGSSASFGGAHAIAIDPDSGALIGAADPRKGGCALGF